jgi:hypothetical protein
MNAQAAKPAVDREEIAARLYQIRNIANLISMCPEEKAEAYVLQNVIAHISDMVQGLIESLSD